MSNVAITTNATSVFTNTPYNADFVSAAKKLGGRWDAAKKAWKFDIRDEATVRALCVTHYGTDGAAIADVVTVRIEFTDTVKVRAGAIEFCGRSIIRAKGRNSGARVCDGVVLVSGVVTSGGSMSNWETIAQEGAVVLVRDFPKARVEELGRIADIRVTVEQEESPAAAQRSVLLAERDRLVARIVEIHALLDALPTEAL